MSESLEDWQKRDRKAMAITASLRGPEPKPDAILGSVVAGFVGFTISLMTLAFAGSHNRNSDLVVLAVTAVCAGATFLFKAITYRSWRKEYWKQMDNLAPKPEPEKPPPLYFKDPKSAIEYACKFLDTTLSDGAFVPCVVVATSTSKESGTFAVVDIPTGDGIKRGIAAFLTRESPPGVAGKLCAAMVGPVIEQTGEPSFLIVAELEPTWCDGAWKITRRF